MTLSNCSKQFVKDLQNQNTFIDLTKEFLYEIENEVITMSFYLKNNDKKEVLANEAF